MGLFLAASLDVKSDLKVFEAFGSFCMLLKVLSPKMLLANSDVDPMAFELLLLVPTDLLDVFPFVAWSSFAFLLADGPSAKKGHNHNTL